MGDAARRRRQGGKTPSTKAKVSQVTVTGDPRARADAALARLLRLNAPGKVSLAGAYALGYGALGVAQTEDDGPEWFHELDPLDALFLGTAWPKMFRDEFEFSNARDAWLRLLRGTVHWSGIERFVHEVVDASEEHDLPVDDGKLMLLIIGRLEDVRLDQRKLPRALLPEQALAGARAIFGPPYDLSLPEPPGDAAELVERFWASTQVELAHDGTAVDALREGLHILTESGMPARSEAAMLLPALYLALVARDDEAVDDAGERAVVWALGLANDSPLLPITDILLVAPQRAQPIDDILGRLFATPAFTVQVRSEDRSWNSSPGRTLINLAFELGHSQILTREAKVVRMTVDTAARLKSQYRRFEEKFGRPPRPDEPILFDPEADTPQIPSLTEMARETVAFMQRVGLDPAWIYAYEQTDGLLPRSDGTFLTDQDAQEWYGAVDDYVSRHGGQDPDDSENLQILNTIALLTDLQTGVADPEYGATLLQRLGSEGDAGDLLRAFVRHMAEHLTERLRSDAGVRSEAQEHARAWAGAELAGRVRAAVSADAKTIDDAEVLLVIAAADHGGRGA